MNRDHVLAELPTATVAWLATADPRTLDQIARDVAARTVTRLLSGEQAGDAAWDHVQYDLLRRDLSPAVRALAATLPHARTGGRWSQKGVVRAACAFFGLAGSGVKRDVAARVRHLQEDFLSIPVAARRAA